MPARLAQAVAAAQGLFPPGAEVAGCLIGTAPPPWPCEAAAVATSVSVRQAEFAAGRAAARLALEGLGLPPRGIPVCDSRAPCWPAGIVGSITHTETLALAALAPALQCRAMGLDAEPDAPLPEDLLTTIARPDEQRWIAAQPIPLRAARMLFVAKEAAYKCQFPISQTVIGFEAIRVSFAPDWRIEAVFAVPVPPFAAGQRLRGRMALAAGLIIAGFSVAA